MLVFSLQDATTCTKDSRLQAEYHAYQEDEDQVVMRFCRDTFHGEGFAVFFLAPHAPSSNNDHIYPVRMEIGLQVGLASVCQMFSGSSSVVSFMHAHQKAAHRRGI